jgi:amino-acid N-acetyltransferase
MTNMQSSTNSNPIPGATLRPARADDLGAVTQLLTASKLPLDGVADALARFVVVVEPNGNVVGVAGLERCGAYALLRSVAVAEAWRSRGVGRALVERVIEDAERRGIPALYLLTTTAARYFRGFGFREITRDEVPGDVRATAEFTHACPASATVMTRASDHGRHDGLGMPRPLIP